MKIGLDIVRFGLSGHPENTPADLKQVAQTADEGGFSSLWVMDHFYQIEPLLGKVTEPLLESYSVLNYLAGITKKVRLGSLVSGVIYRHPSLLVKTVTSLDVLSAGRAYFGIGTGWYERECKGLGFDFPPLKERFERLEENLQIAQHLWSGSPDPYIGKFHTLQEPISSPQPISRPHPPILIGGGGEKKTLRMVAQYGDACNLYAQLGKKEIQRKLDILKAHCDDAGRSYESIEKTALARIDFDPGEARAADVMALCKDMVEAGIEHLIFYFSGEKIMKPIEFFVNEIIPEVSGF